MLRPGSQLVFMTNAGFAVACMPDLDGEKMTAALQRPYLGLYSVQWPEGDEVEFYLTHGQWIELLTSNGFAVERLLELGAPPGAQTSYAWADAEWAQSWPSEEVWFARYEP